MISDHLIDFSQYKDQKLLWQFDLNIISGRGRLHEMIVKGGNK